LPAVCSCFTCGNIIAHAAAYPAQGFKIKCAEHIGASGFRTVDQFEKYVAVYSLHKKDGGR
jgi:DNA-directed RNA polymerase subunit N (RpoN/RPB10)